jgi:cation diffusion facilitator family transporter
MVEDAPGSQFERERVALVASMVVTAALSVLGLLWGWLTGSRMILLDGVYGLIGLLVSWLLLHASALADSDESSEYPYGREAATPLVIGVQGFVLLATLVYAGVGAVQTIQQGGAEVTAGWGIAYSVIATAASLGFWWWIQARAGTSDLMVAEATAWRVAALRGVGMVIGFTVMLVFSRSSSLQRWTPYVDPAMVLVTCVVFLPAPVRMVRTTVRELLEAAPPRSVQQPVKAIIADICRQFDLDTPKVRMTKVGPKLYVEVEGTVAPDVTVTQEHEVRTALQSRLQTLPYEVWLNLEFTPRVDAMRQNPPS